MIKPNIFRRKKKKAIGGFRSRKKKALRIRKKKNKPIRAKIRKRRSNPNSRSLTIRKRKFKLRKLMPRKQKRNSRIKRRRLKKGVNLIGFIRAESGLGESSRMMANSLQARNVPFGIIDYNSEQHSTKAIDLTWRHKETTKAKYQANVFHMNADHLQHAYHFFGGRVFKRRYNIGYWHWELPDFPEEWCESFKLVREVWVPSNFVLDSVIRKSPVPVIRIPHAIEVSVPPYITRESFALPNDQFLFLCMFDAQSIMDRKNPFGAIEAFKRAFDLQETSVGLIVKINHPFPEAMEQLVQSVQGYGNIYLLPNVLNRLEANALINCSDCVVSLHRAEGFGLALAEAMYLGKPVIGTNWSGNTDFMNEMNSCTVNYGLVEIGRDLGPYKAYQTWAEPDIDHAASYMRQLVSQPEWRQMIALNGQATIHTHFSPMGIGMMIQQQLMSLGLL